jgi:hypothetical protein
LDTRHRGYHSAQEATLAANGLGPQGIDELRLERGSLVAIDISGRRRRCTAMVAWTISELSVDLPTEFLFERIDCTPSDLSARGLDGAFDAKAFRVLDDRTELDVDVRLMASRRRLVVLLGSSPRIRSPRLDVPSA